MNGWGVLVGLAAGFVSGCGIGGGSLLLLYLTAVAGVAPYEAGGINLLFFLCCAPAALFLHAKKGLIQKQGLAAAIGAGVVTAIAASWCASFVPTDWMRRAFGVLLLYIGAKELFCKR